MPRKLGRGLAHGYAAYFAVDLPFEAAFDLDRLVKELEFNERKTRWRVAERFDVSERAG